MSSMVADFMHLSIIVSDAVKTSADGTVRVRDHFLMTKNLFTIILFQQLMVWQFVKTVDGLFKINSKNVSVTCATQEMLKNNSKKPKK